MVLEDVDKMAPDSFSDAPPSQEDPYASSRPPSRASGSRFDASDMARPIPIIGRFMGFSDAAVRFKTETTLDFAERKVGRSLDPEEAQALAGHIYQLEQSKSYFAAAGAVAGIYRWNKTGVNQYPFYKAKIEDVDPNKFGFVKGPWANLARQTWRFSLYVLVAGQMGSIIGQVIAQPMAAQATSRDPKLVQFGQELKASTADDQKKNTERSRMIEERRKDFEERRAKEKTGGALPPYSGWGQDRKQTSHDDDMSPTSGNDSWSDFTPDTPQSAPQQQQISFSTDTNTRRSPPYQSSQSPLMFDDDASPTGGLFQDEVNNPPTSAKPQSRPGESSWERLRRGGAPLAQPPRPTDSGRRAVPERRAGSASESTVGDDFTFVEGREERMREKERAQREFDERLERERQGRDFSGDGGKRW
jgi:hypothetical protein